MGAPDRNEGSLRQSSWNRSSSEDWTDPSLCEESRQVQGRGCGCPEEEQVQVLWQAEDLRQQEVWLHQVEPRRVPGDEGSGHLKTDGVNVQCMPEHGPLSVWCKTQMELAGL